MIFIDTGAFLGRYLPDDQHHAAALAGWEDLAERRLACCTSNLVLSETITLLARRADYGFAAEKARLIQASTVLRMLRPTREDELAAVDWLEKFADQKVSYTDAVSFALMRRYRLTRAFTFDRHFELAGFKGLR
jgi:predicted nucleic acid-binding protein